MARPLATRCTCRVYYIILYTLYNVYVYNGQTVGHPLHLPCVLVCVCVCVCACVCVCVCVCRPAIHPWCVRVRVRVCVRGGVEDGGIHVNISLPAR